MLRAGYGNKEGKGILRADYRNKKFFNFASYFNILWIQKYYKNESRFNRVYSRDNLHKKIKVGAYVINLDEYANVGAHWIALYVKSIENIYVYS